MSWHCVADLFAGMVIAFFILGALGCFVGGKK